MFALKDLVLFYYDSSLDIILYQANSSVFTYNESLFNDRSYFNAPIKNFSTIEECNNNSENFEIIHPTGVNITTYWNTSCERDILYRMIIIGSTNERMISNTTVDSSTSLPVLVVMILVVFIILAIFSVLFSKMRVNKLNEELEKMKNENINEIPYLDDDESDTDEEEKHKKHKKHKRPK